MGNRSSSTRLQSHPQYDYPPPSYSDSDTKPISGCPPKGDGLKDNESFKSNIAGSSSYGSPQPRPSRLNLRGRKRQNSIPEDALQTLSRYDVWVLVDDSGSMGDDGSQRWLEARDALAPIAEAAGRYDEDGFDLFFLNSRKTGEGLKNSPAVLQIFADVSPAGATPLGIRLEELLCPYIEKLEAAKSYPEVRTIKPVDILVITDGAPTDDPESVIVAAAQRLDKGQFPLSQVGIQFIQVGDDSRASRYLKGLDDSLTQKHHIRDIVDTIPASRFKGRLGSDAIMKALLGGINRLVDKSS